MSKIFYSFLISCFIFTIISCGKTTEENVNDAVSKTNDTVFGGSGGSATSAGDEVPTKVVFGKTILAPVMESYLNSTTTSSNYDAKN